MDYLVKIIGHLVEPLRPDGFPKEVINAFIVRAETESALNEKVEEHANFFITVGGMIVLKNPRDVQEVDENGRLKGRDRRMFIPMSMLTHMDTETTPMASQYPDLEGAQLQ